MKRDIDALHGALIDLFAVMGRPQPDAALIADAGVALDRALFPLLVTIERRGPIGIVELADRIGRDHTTVSRQVAKLASLGLVVRGASKADARVHEAAVTAKGRAMTQALDAARERALAPILTRWNAKDRTGFVRLLRRFADDMTAWAKR